MTTWNKIIINKQNILVDTGKAVLVQMPKSTGYAKYSFWHPKSLVRAAKGWDLSLSFSDEFTFKLEQKGQGRYNKNQTIDTKEFSAQDFLALFEK